MDEKNFEQVVLQHVEKPEYQPVKPKVIAKQLNVEPDDRKDLRRAIKRLVKQGKLIWGNKHTIFPATEENRKKFGKAAPSGDGQTGRSVISGVFRRTSKGFGFVRPAGTSRAAGRSEDIYVPARQTLDAADGDLVALRLSSRRGPAGKRSGAVVEVLERETHQFVGVYHERGGYGYVQVDGKVFTEPILVGDPGAKGAMPDDKVVIEMVRFPSHMHEGEGVLVEVLGARGEPGVDTLSIIREYNLPDEFSQDVLSDARQAAHGFDAEVGERLDLTGETIITIDPVDARDFDDAISLQRLENGHWRLGVHIADVSHFVRPKTPLDDEARDRGTSVYLPDRVIPMLPETISNHLASLQPGRVRYTKTAFVEMTAEGARVATDVHSAAIESKRRFTYEEVDEFLADREAWREKLDPSVFELLERMHELAMLLRRRRLEGGAIELTMPEIKIDLNKKGEVKGAHLVENTESHQIIEEFMLAANEAVAEMLHDRELYFLRRIHQAPDPRKLRTLTSFVRELGFDAENMQNRFETKRIIEEVEGRPEQQAVNFAVLRSMQKAVYGPEVEGHYALNMKHYCHFTSPIRRYPDLTVHRLLEQIIQGETPTSDFEALAVLGEHCSEREQRAAGAERDLIKVKLLTYMAKRIGKSMPAIITGVEDFGLFAQGLKLPAEGMIHISALSDDYYDYDRETHTLTGRRGGNSFRLGDVLEVEVAHVDIDQRQLDFRFVKRLQKAPAPPKRKSPRKPQRGPKKKTAAKGKTTGKAKGKTKKKATRSKTKRAK